MDHDNKVVCGFDKGKVGHSIEECIEFKWLLQKLMDEQLVQIGFNDEEDQLTVIEGSDMINGTQASLFSLSTLVIHYNKNSSSLPLQIPTLKL